MTIVYTNPFEAGDRTVAAEFAAGETKTPTALLGTAVPFGAVSGPSSDGTRWRFSGPPVNADELVDVVDQHDDEAIIGRLGEPWSVTESGLDARARMFKTTHARDVMELAAEGVRTGFSVKAEILEFAEATDELGPFGDVTSWHAHHLGVVTRPAFTESRGLTLAASAQKESTMPPTAAPPADREIVELPTIAELAAKVAEVLDDSDRKGRHPLARFASREHYLAELQAAVLSKDLETAERLSVEFAAVGQVVADNPGLMPPSWRTAIVANLDARRPLIALTGGAIGLGETGMDSNWPYFDGDLDAMIGEQLAELNELASVKVSIKKGTASIKTAGVYSELTYQLLMRSTPKYLAQYLAINEAAWARYTEAKFETTVAAGGTESSGALQAAGAITASAFRGAMFDASMDVEDATGAPASFVLASSDVFGELGKLDALVNSKYGTQNATGTADARTLTLDVNGLPVKRGKFLPAGTVIVSNEQAAKFAESGPMTSTAEDVAKLGQNVATWGMYVPAEIYFPKGIVRLDRTP